MAAPPRVGSIFRTFTLSREQNDEAPVGGVSGRQRPPRRSAPPVPSPAPASGGVRPVGGGDRRSNNLAPIIRGKYESYPATAIMKICIFRALRDFVEGNLLIYIVIEVFFFIYFLFLFSVI